MENTRNEAKSVPLIIYESEMKHKTSIIKWLFIIIIVLIIVLSFSIYLFLSFINSYDFVGYEQDGDGINNINTGQQGDVVNGSKITN